MIVIVTETELSVDEKLEVLRNNFGRFYTLSNNDYNGLSTLDIHKLIVTETSNKAIITSNSQILLNASKSYATDCLYLLKGYEVVNILKCTSRASRSGKNLLRMYEENAFDLQTQS